MSELYRLRCTEPDVGETPDAESEHTSSCYELVDGYFLTRAEAAADPEVRALVMASIIVEHLWWIRHRSEATDDE